MERFMAAWVRSLSAEPCHRATVTDWTPLCAEETNGTPFLARDPARELSHSNRLRGKQPGYLTKPCSFLTVGEIWQIR
ncbi:hypothetical protein SKAU_G00003770 [Synaphobranchus kaupii]|uniref:Uncharacterized protein n=1 Tax=Synaphobranchus kaupii TaxID=118154 RepID=A0A9Q1G9W5_SYNKA|nr:hypothetical protein SKAU_G00003770 [Synaphobranchus kaupii]